MSDVPAVITVTSIGETIVVDQVDDDVVVVVLDPDGDTVVVDVADAVSVIDVVTMSIPGPPGPPGGPAGPEGPAGPTGPTGPTGQAEAWSSGAGAPASGAAVVGDWYLNTTNGDVYEKTGTSTWTARGNIRGPQGIQGVIGPPGVDGSDPAVHPFFRTVVTGSESRPTGAVVVFWLGGTVEPVNMVNGDIWFAAGAAGPPTAPTIVTTELGVVTETVAYTRTLFASGTTPFTWSIASGVLPAGLTLGSSSGIISGTPTTPGFYTFTVAATSTVGADTQLFTGSIATAPAAPVITTTTLFALNEDNSFTQTLGATGDIPITWTVTGGTLPAGITMSTAGVLAGTPTTTGSYSFTVTATNVVGSDTQLYTGTIGAPIPVPPTVTTTTLNALAQSVAFSQNLLATGSTPITWAVTTGAIPAGLSLTSGGLLSGTPSGTGSYSFTVTATNAHGTDTQAYSGTVSAAPTAPTVTTTTLNTMNNGTAFTQTLAATGTTPITWAVTTGSAPTGLTLSTAGVLSGTPTVTGAYSFTVTATNSVGADTQAYSGSVLGSTGRFFFSTTTPDTSTVNTDGGGSLQHGNYWYATVPINVLGARVWNPSTADSTFLNMDVEVRAYARDWTGTSPLPGNITTLTPTTSKTDSATRVAGTWTPVYFDTPIALNAISSTANPPDCVCIALYFDGNRYVNMDDTTFVSGDRDSDLDGNAVNHAENGFPKGTNSFNLSTSTYYGIDLIYELV